MAAAQRTGRSLRRWRGLVVCLRRKKAVGYAALRPRQGKACGRLKRCTKNPHASGSLLANSVWLRARLGSGRLRCATPTAGKGKKDIFRPAEGQCSRAAEPVKAPLAALGARRGLDGTCRAPPSVYHLAGKCRGFGWRRICLFVPSSPSCGNIYPHLL